MANYPDLYIVGAAKCGTTSLHEYLAQHPDIYMSAHKEPHYFADISPDADMAHMIKKIDSEADYLSLFTEGQSALRVGESSPSYLWSTGAAQRIHDKRPDARIIILLRDPVDRAYSHYLMDVREGIQALGFRDALELDLSIQDKSWGSGEGHMYVDLGMYAQQVKIYLDTFGRDQVFVGMFEDLKHNPRVFTEQVLEFLDVSVNGGEQIDFSQEHNPYAAPRGGLGRLIMAQGWLRRLVQIVFPPVLRKRLKETLILKKGDKPELDAETKARLKRIFFEDLVELEALLGKPLPELRVTWGD